MALEWGLDYKFYNFSDPLSNHDVSVSLKSGGAYFNFTGSTSAKKLYLSLDVAIVS